MSGSAREATTRGEVALNEDVEDAGKRLAAITLAKYVATGASINRRVFIKELFKELLSLGLVAAPEQCALIFDKSDIFCVFCHFGFFFGFL